MRIVNTLWRDDAGFVVSSELILIATISVIGLIAGLATVRDQVVSELADVANAIGHMNQSYSFSGITGHSSSTAGTIFIDLIDFCDGPQVVNTFANCISIITGSTGG